MKKHLIKIEENTMAHKKAGGSSRNAGQTLAKKIRVQKSHGENASLVI